MPASAFRRLQELLAARYPNYAGLWLKSLEQFGPGWEKEISRNIERVFGSGGPAWQAAIDGYAEFCTDALRAQVYFEKTGRYKASSYADVARECYHSADYMERRYLPGQYLSHYIWPHHQRMLKGFLEGMLPRFFEGSGTFYEVGVGCGMYSQMLLQRYPRLTGTGIDISEYSLRFTSAVVRAHGVGERYRTLTLDIGSARLPAPADLVVCQEVLEHLEDPAAFVKRLYLLTAPGRHAYISAAINAAHTDHIFLYRDVPAVAAQIEQAGYRILERQVESSYPEKPVQFRPTIAGFLCERPS